MFPTPYFPPIYFIPEYWERGGAFSPSAGHGRYWAAGWNRMMVEALLRAHKKKLKKRKQEVSLTQTAASHATLHEAVEQAKSTLNTAHATWSVLMAEV